MKQRYRIVPNPLPSYACVHPSTSTSILCACAVDAEAVACLENVRVTAGLVDLLAITSPSGLVDGVDPVLHLQDDAAILGDGTGEVRVVEETLGGLESHTAVLAIARVHLEGFLVRVDVELNTRPSGLQASDKAVGSPVVGAVLFAGHEPAGV